MPLKPIKTKPRLEAIMTNLGRASKFAVDVLNHRWPEAEPYILKDPFFAYYYALNIVKERWPEYEKVLLSNPKQYLNYMIGYATNVLKSRWPEAESHMTLTARNRYLAILRILHGKE